MKKCFILFILYSICITLAQATTIKPFKNLQKLAEVCDLVVIGECLAEYYIDDNGIKKYRYAVEVRDLIKGDQKVKYFDLFTYHLEAANFYRRVSDDIELEAGESYLLFLEKIEDDLYRPIAFSYYLFKEHNYHNKRILMPEGLSKHFSLATNDQYDPLIPMETEKLLHILGGALERKLNYSLQDTKAKVFPQSLEEREFPTHCTNLYGNSNPVRWMSFDDGNPLTIYADSEADASRSNSHSLLASAIGLLNSGYNGVNLTYGGTQNYNPNCATNENDPTGNNLTTFLDGLSTNQSNALVMFNDPCGEYPAYCASGGGTLGYGGNYGYSPKHSWDGIDWWRGRYGYVVIVDDICQPSQSNPWGLSDAEYIIMLKHELTHTLGLSHITAGAALMNPSCCNDISTLDVQCMEHMYLSGSLPVELISFTGENQQNRNHLSWVTQNEINHDFYILERSQDGEHFGPLGEITQANKQGESKYYEFIDIGPIIGQNYYRLKQMDLDGGFSYSEVIAIVFRPTGELKIFPNPVINGKIHLLLPDRSPKTNSLSIFNLLGQKIDYSILGASQGQILQIDLGDVKAGMYVLVYDGLKAKWTEKLLIE